MSGFSDNELIAYVTGELSDDRANLITRSAETNPELSASITLIASLAGVDVSQILADSSRGPFGKRVVDRRALWFGLLNRRTTLAAGMTLLLLVGLGAAWAVIASAPLFEDNFNDRWFDSRIWLHPIRLSKEMGVREEFGYVRLLNRGCIVTQEQFPKPISVEFDWSWVDLAGDPYYADHLAVALRTSGARSPRHAYEVLDGIVVRFNAWAGNVGIASPTDPHLDVFSAPGSLPLAADTRYRIRITDDGETISVYVVGPGIPYKKPVQPILEVNCPNVSDSHHIAIYNRELVANAPHESRIDNFVVYPLPRRDGEQ